MARAVALVVVVWLASPSWGQGIAGPPASSAVASAPSPSVGGVGVGESGAVDVGELGDVGGSGEATAGGPVAAGEGEGSDAAEGSAGAGRSTGSVVLENVLPGLLFAFGMLMLGMVLLRRVMRRAKAGASKEMDLTTGAERVRGVRMQASEGREPLETLMSDAEELARHLAAVMENKAIRLEKLLEEANGVIRRLEGVTGGVAEAVRSAPASATESSPGPSPVSSRGVARAGPSSSVASGMSGTSSARRSSARRAEVAPPETVEALHRRVYELADSGLGSEAIARELGAGVGRVELILALRPSAG